MGTAGIGRRFALFIVAGISSSLAIALPAASAASIYDPGPVSQVQGTTGDGTLTVSWAPANPGTSSSGSPYSIVNYKVFANVPGVNGVVATCQTDTTSCTLRNLVNGVEHFIQITATNSMYGTSNVWSQGPWRPCCAVPAAPALVTAVAADTTASVSWTPPSNAAAAIGPFAYRVVSEPAAVECNTSAQTCDFQGLVNGTTYSFIVTASTSVGTSPGARSAAVLPKGLPGVPVSVVGYLGERGRVDVTWVGPASTGGVAVLEYVATANPGGANCVSPGGITCTIAGLANGQDYTFTVAARNEVGWSAVSAPSAVARLIAGPGKPRVVKVSVVRGSATVAWQPPVSTGGLIVTKYIVKASPGGRSCATTTLTCRVSGLSDGASYTFAVQAFNKLGAGLPGPSAVTRMPSAPVAAPAPEKPTQTLS